jgi:FdhD protein
MEIVSIATSRKKGTKKTCVKEAELIAEHGIKGDAHAGKWHRQVCFLASESIEKARSRGLDVTFGDFAENIATTGIDWKNIPVGTRLRLGEKALVEITQIGKECKQKCAIFYQAGDCIMPREGVFAKVIEGGIILRGDKIIFVLPEASLIHWNNKTEVQVNHFLIGEEPLSIRIQGKPYSVVMRTPGDEIAHVAGFCLGEGVIDSPDDIASIGFCDGTDSNVVTVTLTPDRREIVSDILDRRGFVSQTSCGLCGKELIEDLYQSIKPLTDDLSIDIKKALNCLESLSDLQPVRKATRSSHAAAIFSSECELLSVAEDVGRHNALDKAIGKLFLGKKLSQASLLVLSSRVSFELVQKAAKANIPILLAISRPTELAVKLAREINMTIACLAKDGGLFIYCGEKRLKRDL